jgi:hypothetical protein
MDSYGVQRRAWRRPAPVRSNSAGVVAAARGVALQGRGWPHRVDSDGDDRSRRPDVTAWPCVSTEKTFEGAAGPLRGRGVLAVQEWAAQCHGADTGLVAQRPTVAGMGSPWGVDGTAPGRDS